MHAFIVPANTPILVIRTNVEWVPQNFRRATTTHENLFFAEDLRIDPTGIQPSACVPSGVAIGSAYAERGYFGFLRAGETHYCLVHARYLTQG